MLAIGDNIKFGWIHMNPPKFDMSAYITKIKQPILAPSDAVKYVEIQQ